MAQWLRTLALLAEDMGVVTSPYMAFYNCPQLQFQGLKPSSGLSGHQPHMQYKYIHIKYKQHLNKYNNKSTKYGRKQGFREEQVECSKSVTCE